MRIFSYIVLFTLHLTVWLIVLITFAMFIYYFVEIIVPDDPSTRIGPSLIGLFTVPATLLAFWLSFKSTSYSAGENYGFLKSMKLATLEVKYFFSGFFN